MKVFTVGDQFRAAVLLTQGVKLIDCRPKGKRLVWVFDASEGSATWASSAIVQDLPVRIGTFQNNFNRCRELLYQFRMTYTPDPEEFGHRGTAEPKPEVKL
jgi:hypothetical protein